MNVANLDIPQMQEIMDLHAYKEITVTQNFLNSFKAFHNSMHHILEACPLIFKEYKIMIQNYITCVEGDALDENEYHKQAGEWLYTISRYLQF